MIINDFILRVLPTGTVVLDAQRCAEALNGRRNIQGVKFVRDDGTVSDSGSLWIKPDGTLGFRLMSEKLPHFIMDSQVHAEYKRVSQFLNYTEIYDTLEEAGVFCTKDIKGYCSWRSWDNDFLVDHNIQFAAKDYPSFGIRKGDCLLTTYREDGNEINLIQVMATKEDREQTDEEGVRKRIPKYRNLVGGVPKGLGFNLDNTNNGPLLLVEGALDLYRAADRYPNYTVACLGGHELSQAIMKDLEEYLVGRKVERIYFYLESDIEDATNLRAKLSSVLEKVYEATGFAPGVSFVRAENMFLMMKNATAPEKIDYKDFVRLDFDDVYLQDAYKMIEVGYTYKYRESKNGNYYKRVDVEPIHQRYKNPHAIHISGTTGDGKTKSALNMMNAFHGHKVIFSCFNVDEVKNNLEKVPGALAISSEFRYGYGTDIQKEYESRTKSIEIQCKTFEEKQEAYRQLDFEMDEKFKYLLEQGHPVLSTHSYLQRLIYIYKWMPELIFIDEEFSTYAPWYKRKSSFRFDGIACSQSILEHPYMMSATLVYLDGTGAYKLENKYHHFFAGSYRCDILDALRDVQADEWIFDGVNELVTSGKFKTDQFKMVPQSHQHVHVNFNLVSTDNIVNNRKALAYDANAGTQLVDMIVENKYVPHHSKKLLLVVYKEQIYSIFKAISRYEDSKHVERGALIHDWYCTEDCKTIFNNERLVNVNGIDIEEDVFKIQEGQHKYLEEASTLYENFKKSPDAMKILLMGEVQDNYEKFMASMEEIEGAHKQASRLSARKELYSIEGKDIDKLGDYLRRFEEIVISTWAHGRGTNKWRGFENITMIGSFNKPLSTDSDAAAEAWQFLMRGAGRTGSYCLVNWWVGTHTLPAALEWFPQWDNIKSVMPQCRYWYRSYDYVDGKLHLRQEATEDLDSFKETEKEACEKYGVMQSYDPNYQEKRLKYAEMTMNDCVENYNNPKCDTKKRERIMARLRDLLGLESAREVRAKLKDMGIELADSRGQSLNTWKNLVK